MLSNLASSYGKSERPPKEELEHHICWKKKEPARTMRPSGNGMVALVLSIGDLDLWGKKEATRLLMLHSMMYWFSVAKGSCIAYHREPQHGATRGCWDLEL